MIVDRNILRYERTQYAKQIRKDYESGKIKERRCNLRKYAIRTDGLCNTISTVLKDNYLLERRILEVDAMTKNVIRLGKINSSQDSVIVDPLGISPTHTAGHGNQPKIKELETMRIRKLTPKECWRLMGFDDSDFEKAEKVNSNTQLYKQAGNSIVVDVLCYIFGNLLESGILGE